MCQLCNPALILLTYSFQKVVFLLLLQVWREWAEEKGKNARMQAHILKLWPSDYYYFYYYKEREQPESHFLTVFFFLVVLYIYFSNIIMFILTCVQVYISVYFYISSVVYVSSKGLFLYSNIPEKKQQHTHHTLTIL
jgi:hypothetical protein